MVVLDTKLEYEEYLLWKQKLNEDRMTQFVVK